MNRQRVSHLSRYGMVCLITIISSGHNANALSREQCRSLLPATVALQGSIRGIIESNEAVPSISSDKSLDLSNMMAEAAAMDTTRQDLIKSLKAHLVAIQDSVYQLERCSR
jgi:hypothetical protein